LDRVSARLTNEVAVLLQEPPATTEWVDIAYYECVAEAVLQDVGEARLGDLFADAQRTGWAVLITRWGGSIVRVFGASPATVLKHAEARSPGVADAAERNSEEMRSGQCDHDPLS
jgi:hypothetical protein